MAQIPKASSLITRRSPAHHHDAQTVTWVRRDAGAVNMLSLARKYQVEEDCAIGQVAKRHCATPNPMGTVRGRQQSRQIATGQAIRLLESVAGFSAATAVGIV